MWTVLLVLLLGSAGVAAILLTFRRLRATRTVSDEEPTHFETTAAEQRNGAAHEEWLMACAPHEGAASVPAEQAIRPLSIDGMVHVERVLDSTIASALLVHITETLARDIESPGHEPAVLVGAAGTIGGAEHDDGAPPVRFRHDIKVDIAQPVVREALTQVLGVVGGAISQLLGPLAELHECGALVAEPGAHQQPLHPDTAWSDSAAVCVVFVG